MKSERHLLFWIGAALALLIFIGVLRPVLLPFVTGIVIAYFLNPVADRLTAMGLPRVAASLLIVLGVGIGLAALLFLVLPLLANQVQQFVTALPGELERLKGLIEVFARDQLGDRYPLYQESFNRWTASLGDNWGNMAGAAVERLWSHGLAFFNFVALMLVTPLVVFYLLVDWHPMLAKVDSWLPRDHAPTIRRLASEVNDAVSAFIRGQGVVCIILGAFYALALSAVGLKYGLLVGLMTGVLAFIPFVGWALGLLTALGLAVVQFWPDLWPILLVGLIFVLGQLIDAGFLSPKIVGSKIGLHPVWLIFALLVFSYLFGFVGTLVAVPVAAAIGVLVRYALEIYLKSKVYAGGAAAGSGRT